MAIGSTITMTASYSKVEQSLDRAEREVDHEQPRDRTSPAFPLTA
ncbi:hypothetical protein ACSDR0_16700 [Streptosporangium sp. G11]